jgi:hypothetical protein
MIKYYRQVQLLTLKGRTQYRVMKGTPSKSEYETGRTYLHGMENTVLNHGWRTPSTFEYQASRSTYI